jgi:hypothetical protein
MLAFTIPLCYTIHMKNKKNPVATNTDLSVREAVERGISVSLPNLLDVWTLWKEDDDVREYDILWYMASEVSNDHDLTHNQADDIVRYTLTSLGVEL